MSGWNYDSRLESFYMSDKFYLVILVFGVFVLILGIIYFVDGVYKYGYWLHKGKKDEG